MDFFEYSDDGPSASGSMGYPLHDLCQAGEAAALEELLRQLNHDDEEEDYDPEAPPSKGPGSASNLDLDERDDDECTPLHVALLHGHLECAKLLLSHGASPQAPCEGSPPLHVAISKGALSNYEQFAHDAVTLLLAHGASVYDKDDHDRTPLHMAASLGLVHVAKTLLDRAMEEQREALERKKNSNIDPSTLAALACEGIDPFPTPPSLLTMQDANGQSALHVAARHGHASTMELLLTAAASSLSSNNEEQVDGVATLLLLHTRGGKQSALHLAAYGGSASCVELLVKAAKDKKRAESLGVTFLSEPDRRGHTAHDIAAARGFTASCALLKPALPPSHPPPLAPLTKPAVGKEARTALIAPPQCLSHHTCSEPITRDTSDIPPENSNRLRVLTRQDWGILHSSEFSKLHASDALTTNHDDDDNDKKKKKDKKSIDQPPSSSSSSSLSLCRWDFKSPHVALADLLRVHEWTYVRRIQQLCASLPDRPEATGHLDGDTAVSRLTYAASLAAAGAVTHAVDKVMRGDVRNAFCAVRPPGHHAGPVGVVTNAMDPRGSHGFCLFNNVAIGAAYAMHVYRHQGIERVAILDFDVHHGNGTQACVLSVVPQSQRYAFKTPLSEGTQTFQVWRPWLDTKDSDNIFFASCQGYGPKAPGMDSFVYPASGATCDTRPYHPSDTAMDEQQRHEEDPNQEFEYHGGEAPDGNGPRVINVGIEKQGPDPALWRRAWRDKILPALVNFRPDMIFISAGFDAHKKDEINFGYLGIQEREYEWLTEQIVQIANKYCDGRIVSVLEGGYRIQGGIVSAFARSVAAHVRALSEPHGQVYDEHEAKFEREHERKRKMELEARRKAEAAALLEGGGGGGGGGGVWGEGPGEGPGGAKAEEVAPSGVEAEGEGRENKRRRKGPVDYVALNKKLEEEEKAKQTMS